jgi:SAM-dependent methyltransferase
VDPSGGCPSIPVSSPVSDTGFPARIERSEGRRLFGFDPAAYDRARPGHSERVYEVLVERCGLGSGTSVLEVGAGTGQATRRLLELGASPLVAVEPDPTLASHLERTLGERVDVRVTTLEDVELPDKTFDLAAAASSFHWIDEPVGLAKVFAALRPQGWVAVWWTLFGIDDVEDPFIEATTPLIDHLSPSPSHVAPGKPYALEAEARLAALRAAGFADAEHETMRWRTSWDTDGIRELYGTFSPIARLGDREKAEILDGVARIAREDFGGRVERVLLTSLYTACKAE